MSFYIHFILLLSSPPQASTRLFLLSPLPYEAVKTDYDLANALKVKANFSAPLISLNFHFYLVFRLNIP